MAIDDREICHEKNTKQSPILSYVSFNLAIISCISIYNFLLLQIYVKEPFYVVGIPKSLEHVFIIVIIIIIMRKKSIHTKWFFISDGKKGKHKPIDINQRRTELFLNIITVTLSLLHCYCFGSFTYYARVREREDRNINRQFEFGFIFIVAFVAHKIHMHTKTDTCDFFFT